MEKEDILRFLFRKINILIPKNKKRKGLKLFCWISETYFFGGPEP